MRSGGIEALKLMPVPRANANPGNTVEFPSHRCDRAATAATQRGASKTDMVPNRRERFSGEEASSSPFKRTLYRRASMLGAAGARTLEL